MTNSDPLISSKDVWTYTGERIVRFVNCVWQFNVHIYAKESGSHATFKTDYRLNLNPWNSITSKKNDGEEVPWHSSGQWFYRCVSNTSL